MAYTFARVMPHTGMPHSHLMKLHFTFLPLWDDHPPSLSFKDTDWAGKVMWTRSVWPALTPWILTRTSPASRSAAGKKTSHNFHNSHHLTIETWPEPWMGMRKRQQLELFFLSAMCSLCKWGKIKIQVSYNSKIYFDIACIRKCDERSWL